jgi:hypothetical protein
VAVSAVGCVSTGSLTTVGARFHACRYPVRPVDTAAKFDPQTHDHVVFVRKNRFFEVPLASLEGEELSAAELQVCVGSFRGRVIG